MPQRAKTTASRRPGQAKSAKANADASHAEVVSTFSEGAAAVTALLRARGGANARDDAGQTPLHPAAAFSYPDVMAALLECGAKVDVVDEQGVTPLSLAADALVLSDFGPREFACVKLLMDRGAQLPDWTSLLEEAPDSDDHAAFRKYLADRGALEGSGDSAYSAFLDDLRRASAKKRATLLATHFEPWLLTDECHKVLAFLLARLERCTVAKDSFTLVIGGVPALFGKPGSEQGESSAAVVNRTHGTMIFGAPKKFGESLFYPGGGYDPSEEREGRSTLRRFDGLCDAGQNWIVHDRRKKNAQGEPTLCLWEHGAPLAEAAPFPGQTQGGYGVGGLLLRVLAHMVAPEEFEGFGYG